MLMRCPERASNNQGRSTLPHVAVAFLALDTKGDKKVVSVVMATRHVRSDCVTEIQ